MKLNESVSRAIDIINLIALSNRPMTLAEICKKTRIPKTTVFGILHTLVEKNTLEIADPNTKTFRLGLGLFETTLSALSSIDLLSAARPMLEELSLLVNETVLFAVESRGEMVFLEKFEGESTLQLRATVKLGARVHMHCTAIGKAVLAALPESDLLAFLSQGGLTRKTETTIVNRAELMKDLSAVRARGYSVDNEENVDGVLCIGAPIYSRLKKVIAGSSITMQASSADQDKVEYYGMLINSTALKISRRLGYSESSLYWEHDRQNEDEARSIDTGATAEIPSGTAIFGKER